MAFPPMSTPLNPTPTPPTPAQPNMSTATSATPTAQPYRWVPPTLTMSREDVQQWWMRIELDKQRRDRESQLWKRLFRAYLPFPNSANVADPYNINSNVHFTDVHVKMASMWAQFPKMILEPLLPLSNVPALDQNGQPVVQQTPQGPQPMMMAKEDVVAIKKAVLDKKLADANAELMAEECLFDLFMTSGVTPTKICYESDVKYTPQEPTPMIPGAVLGLSTPPPAPEPQVVNERWRWYHFSPEKLGIPYNFHSTNWDAAPYLWMEFVEPWNESTRRAYQLPQDFRPTALRDNATIVADNDAESKGTTPLLKGYEVWLHAAEFDPNEPDRDVFYRLVLVDGLRDKPAIYEFSPYQSKDQFGRLTYDSMIGNPIHPINVRVASDTQWIKSDAAFTDPLVQLENKWAQQDVEIREANKPRFLHNSRITEAINKIGTSAETGQGVAVDDEAMALGIQRLIQPLPHLERAESDIQGREYIRRYRMETLGLSSNQAGSTTQTRRSATEVATIQANISARLRQEQTNFLQAIMRGIPKFDALLMRYMTDLDYVQIVGQDGTRRLQPFRNAHLAGRYAYDAIPDTQLSLDASSRFDRTMKTFEFLAKSQYVNQKEFVSQVLNEAGFDATRLTQNPPPPPPQDKPNISFAFKAEDLAIPEVRAILMGAGINIGPVSPQAQVASAAAEAKGPAGHPPLHGGPADKVEPLSKHHAEQTGNQKGPQPLAGEPAKRVPGAQVLQ